MPIRRGDSVSGGRSGAGGESGALTEPSSQGDSIFSETPSAVRSRMESETKRIKEADESRTRILAPSRHGAEAAALPQDDPMADPPAGWLVVVRGPGKGRTLTLGHGMNALGRGASARVRIDFGDQNISRANHARVAYDPRTRRWMLSHGDGSNLTYLNGNAVMDAVEMRSGASIQIGETTLRFQAFCGEDFDWRDVDG